MLEGISRAIYMRAALFMLAGAFGLTAFSAARAADAPPAHPAPIVPGYERLKDAKLDPVTRGEVLLGELNCLACHAAEGQKHVLTKGAPDLSNVGARVTPQFLKAYLSDPHGEKPGSTMPDIFRASEPAMKQGAVEFLTHYLASLGGPVAPATVEGNPVAVDQGRVLYHTIGCVACHAPEKGFAPPAPHGGGSDQTTPKAAAVARAGLASVPLGNLASKTTVDQLAAFLLDPLKTRPGSRMPASNLTPDEARAVATYLLREQLDNPAAAKAGPMRTAGLHYAYYDKLRVLSAEIDRLKKARPTSEGTIDNFNPAVPNHREENFAVLFTGAVHVPRTGSYTFYVKSDDGSRLYIDGKSVVNNDGVHSPDEKSGSMDLQQGDHPIDVGFFQAGGGFELTVEWEGPDIKRQTIPNDALFHVGGRPMIPLGGEPFTVDPQKAQMGKQMFAAMGCASCHAIPGEQSTRAGKPLAQIDPEAAGCLAEHVARGLPDYELSAEQRESLAAAIKADKDPAMISAPLEPKQQVIHAIAALNCVACHTRDNIGGPGAGKDEYFGLTGNFDLGDEGRIPPRLTNVGGKLLPAAIEQIVFEGKLHVRPWMATRMPRFSREVLASLPRALAQADGPEPDTLPAFSAASAADGRTLVGVKGMGCINCHGVGGNKSLGIPSIDLSTVHERLRPGWFHSYLVDPPRKNPGTRMPAFWADGKVSIPAIAGGTMDGQIDAIWNYASLGNSMPLPAGIRPLAGAGMELTPTDEPIVHRTFMADVGSRSILVGFPERIHVAFDANTIRLAKAWHGRFFDAAGQWDGRGGKLNPPLGTDVINLPPGSSFAVLGSPDARWPVLKYDERNSTVHFKGYALDEKDRPIFHYLMDVPGGDVDIQEQDMPVLAPGKATLVREFHLKSDAPPKDLYFQAGWGKKIEPAGAGVWTIDGSLTISLPSGAAAIKPVIRDFNGGKQLLLPVDFAGGAASVKVEMTW